MKTIAITLLFASTAAVQAQTACDGLVDPKRIATCYAWHDFGVATNKTGWTTCGSEPEYSEPCSKSTTTCEEAAGLVDCTKKAWLRSVTVDVEVGATIVNSTLFESALSALKAVDVQAFSLTNQGNLLLESCFEDCAAEGFTCDFSGSDCTSDCNPDGVCREETASPTAAPVVSPPPSPTPETAAPVASPPSPNPQTAAPVASPPSPNPQTAAPVASPPSPNPQTAAPVASPPSPNPQTAAPVASPTAPPVEVGDRDTVAPTSSPTAVNATGSPTASPIEAGATEAPTTTGSASAQAATLALAALLAAGLQQ